jgi:ApbE superfamily uncharacterized protein (UPF0280 family)
VKNGITISNVPLLTKLLLSLLKETLLTKKLNSLSTEMIHLISTGVYFKVKSGEVKTVKNHKKLTRYIAKKPDLLTQVRFYSISKNYSFVCKTQCFFRIVVNQ